ncbi:DUF5658 family protein [Bradyrhizobium sp. CCBAU 53338]|uniref:DUF5658 family protein n=1 Tax=Bradyrhizobium sp. CCBAU 53338 TaxID=1325111 RepID=UPI00188DA56D|nr:DUF5658 family protein [Bradyrhizobium sp. CCBAU 53338]QOZ52219.1 hypothetical protein XH90_13180 [Bradyrhizobium sp. CCBAU 53338]
MIRIKLVLILSVLALGCADLATTNRFLELGFHEANPIMAWSQTLLGQWWLIPKLVATGVVAALLWRAKNVYNVALVVAFLATPVINNLLLIAGAN